MAKVFLDSSVIIAGVNSTSGASNFILKLSKDKEIESFVSEMVIQEVIRNLKKKLPEKVLIEFLKYLAESNFKKVDFEKEATDKAKADYLITLDKKHLLNIEGKTLPFNIVTPGEFLKLKKY